MPISLMLHRLDFETGDFGINATFLSYAVKTECGRQFMQITTNLHRVLLAIRV